MNEKRLKTNIVTVLIALSLFVSFVPSALAQDTAISIGDGSVDPGEKVTVPLMIRNATNVGVVDINITFDPTVVNVEVEEIYVEDLNKWFNVSDFDNPIPVIDNTTGFARIGAFQSENPGLNGDVGIVNLILTAVGDAGSFTTLDITVNELKEATPEGIDIPATVEDSMFTIRGDGNSVISCDSSGDEKNMFMPGEGIYVKAEGLSPSTSYKVWIQDNPVSDGDTLIASEDPSGIQELVTSDGSGSISPTLIWDIPSDAAVTHHEYDIVLDLDSGPNVGVYNSASDRIDSTIAAGVTAPVPELTSIAMVLMGIAVILGYAYRVKK